MKAILIPLLAVPLVFTACDSKQEQAREKALEQRADNLEERAKVEEKVGEARSDALKQEAERTREQK